MKRFPFAVVALFGISMLTPCPVTAEPTHFNEIGLYTTPDGYGETGIDGISIPLEVFLVLTKPAYNGVPCAGIRAFDCRLNFNPAGTMFMLSDSFLSPALNIGDVDNFGDGYLEYIVGYANDLPVLNEAVTLIEFMFLKLNPVPVEVTLGPVSVPSIPGQMVFVATEGPVYQQMHPMSGHPDAPVFIFGGMAIPVESESFGSVKALYR